MTYRVPKEEDITILIRARQALISNNPFEALSIIEQHLKTDFAQTQVNHALKALTDAQTQTQAQTQKEKKK